MFVPKLITVLREGYKREDLYRDLQAGVVVGIVALPLGLAFAIASGVTPERGLFTAIIAGFIISAFGGSRVQIGGPTGAFVVIVYGIVTQFGYDGLAIATIFAGVILIIMGLAKLGTLVKFIPYPVVTGFTSGIALIIFSSQIKDFLGLNMGPVPVDFMEKWVAIAHFLPTIDWITTAVALGTVAILLFWPYVTQKVPAPFVAMIAATAAVQYFALPVETIAARFGAVPGTLPAPSLPSIPAAGLRELVAPAFTIALLAAIESLLSAVVADGMIGTRHRSNIELVAQGIANIASPLFGGIPATGAIARTATNIRTGGRSPIAGITHSLTLFLILILFGKWAGMIPLASLAAILVVVSYHMSEWRSFRGLLRAPRSDVAVLILTFGLTVLVDLTVAVQVGIVVSALLFMRRMAATTNVEAVTDELREQSEDVGEISHYRKGVRILSKVSIPDGVEVYEVNGPFFFGAADKLRSVLFEVAKPPRVFILRMRNVPTIDATGIHTLEQVCLASRRRGTAFVISEIQRAPRRALIRAGMLALIGRPNFQRTLARAMNRAHEIISAESIKRRGSKSV